MRKDLHLESEGKKTTPGTLLTFDWGMKGWEPLITKQEDHKAKKSKKNGRMVGCKCEKKSTFDELELQPKTHPCTQKSNLTSTKLITTGATNHVQKVT